MYIYIYIYVCIDNVYMRKSIQIHVFINNAYCQNLATKFPSSLLLPNGMMDNLVKFSKTSSLLCGSFAKYVLD